MIIPTKLKQGDEIRVIAPSISAQKISDENMSLAKAKIEDLGFKVSLGKNIFEKDLMNSSSIESRLEDLHDAFRDKSVKAILAVLGGYNSNQLLKYIHYDLIQENPKIFCGFSDITALGNAIYTKTGLVTYSGPHYSTFAMQKGNEYTLEYFLQMLSQTSPVHILPSPIWSDDEWFLDQSNREFHSSEGYWIFREGTADGTIIGGNLSTFQLLQGTDYIPSLKDRILFVEADSITSGNDDVEFDRDLQSILQQRDAERIKALVIGRFETKFSMTREKLAYIIQTKKELQDIPIIANVDFGHTMPIFTFPIGGKCKLTVKQGQVDFEMSG